MPPSDWNVFIDDELLVILSPGESRSIVIQFTPDSGSDGTIELFLLNGESIQIHLSVLRSMYYLQEARVTACIYSDSILVILLIVILAGGRFYVFQQKGGSLESIMSKEAVSKITESLNIAEKKLAQELNAGSVAAILLSVRP